MSFHPQNNELQLKLTRAKNRSMLEIDQGVKERSERFQREKNSLMEKNRELCAELDKVLAFECGIWGTGDGSLSNHCTRTHTQMTQDYEQVVSKRQEQEVELQELRQNKELLGQWERQIADIIQWVTEEKDARAYLKSVAKKLADDVENIRTTASTLGRVCVCVCVCAWPTVCVYLCRKRTGWSGEPFAETSRSCWTSSSASRTRSQPRAKSRTS